MHISIHRNSKFKSGQSNQEVAYAFVKYSSEAEFDIEGIVVLVLFNPEVATRVWSWGRIRIVTV